MAVVPREDDSQDIQEEHMLHTSLEGLAERWESTLSIRQRFRKIGGLLEWPCADAIGIPSMILDDKYLIAQFDEFCKHMFLGKEGHTVYNSCYCPGLFSKISKLT